jgi:hypothetical protein
MTNNLLNMLNSPPGVFSVEEMQQLQQQNSNVAAKSGSSFDDTAKSKWHEIRLTLI